MGKPPKQTAEPSATDYEPTEKRIIQRPSPSTDVPADCDDGLSISLCSRWAAAE